MKMMGVTGLMLAMLLAPAAAQAPTKVPSHNCPAMMQGAGMQKGMGAMAADMKNMMAGMRDPEMKGRMQKMHAQMSTMMEHMQKMGSAASPPAAPAEHQEHNPPN